LKNDAKISVRINILSKVIDHTPPEFHSAARNPYTNPKIVFEQGHDLPNHTLPELLFLETKWASLMSYGMTSKLLQDVL
jgi:hypothetical protein